MQLLEVTLDSPAQNLALDEALLEQAEAEDDVRGVLRLWESRQTAVIIGRSSRRTAEVQVEACRADSVPVLRRSSGGTSVVIGPGCLMYAVVLSYERFPDLRMVDEAHRFVLGRVAAAVRHLQPNVKLLGTSDLTVGGRKVSGNSLRCKRDHFLYHGTLLVDFPLDVIGRYLSAPPRQPAYRAGRSHADFVSNLNVDIGQLRQQLIDVWQAEEAGTDIPHQRVNELVAQRYAKEAWHRRL